MSRNIVITGANRGIGLALAKVYGDMGDKVYGICRQASPELEQIVGAEIIPGIDVNNDASLQQIKQKLQHVDIDILINNAGILSTDSFDSIDFDAVENQFKINAIAPLKITSLLKDNLKSGAKVALITSRMGSMEDNNSGAYYGYRMSKAALNAAGKSLSVDLKPQGVAVAILHPGFVQTGMVGFNGDISAEEAAGRLVLRIEELALGNTGTFWHSNGEVLPW